MPLLDLLAGLLMAFLWGVQVVAVKIGTVGLPPLLMVGLRFALIALLLVPFVRVPCRQDWLPMALIALFLGGIHFALVYLGIARLDASTAAISYQLATPASVIIAWAWLGDRVSPGAIAGLLLAFAGVVVLAGAPGPNQDVWGIAMVGLSTVAFAIGTVLTKRHGPFDPLALNAWTALLTAPQIILVSLLLEHGHLGAMLGAGWSSWAAVAYTAVSGGIAGFWLWYWLLGRHPVTRVAPFTLLAPLFAVAAGVIVLHERPGPALFAGAILTLGGVGLIQLAQTRLARRDAIPSG